MAYASGSSVASVRLCDVFFVCGLDLSSGIEENHLMCDYNAGHTPLHRFYKSQVLVSFPENPSNFVINKDAVNMMCMPHGIHFVTAKRIPNPLFHTFIVTKEDGSKTYGSALTFYEPMMDHVVLAALLALQSIHVAELSNAIAHVPPSVGGVTKSLPRHFKIGTTLSQTEVSQGYFDPTKDLLLVSKCIAVIGELPVVHAAKKILFDLLTYVSGTGKKTFSVESVIHNFLYKIPLPMPGQTVAFRTCHQEPVIVTRPGEDELPLLDYSLKELFLIMSVDKVITLLTCVLLEQQILIQSNECQKLMVVAECVTALMAPFTWPHVYVPILPASMVHFLDAPVPFIMGLISSSGKPVINQSNLCVVDLDQGRVDVPEDVPSFPNRSDAVDELSSVCRKYDLEVMSNASSTESGSPQMSTRKHISWGSDSGISSDEGPTFRQNVSEVLQNSEAFRTVSELARKAGVHVNMADLEQSLSQSQLNKPKRTVGNADLDRYIDDMRFNNEVREVMLNRFTMMFGSYENFVVQPNQEKEAWLSCQESNHNFDKAAFLSDQPRQHLPFLSRFMESQTFTTFIDQKILVGFGETHLLVKLFDQRIQKYKGHHRDSVMVRRTMYDLPSAIEDLEKALEKRIATIDLIAPPITEVLSDEALATSLSALKAVDCVGIRFPALNGKILNKEPHRKRRSAGKRRGIVEDELKPMPRVEVSDMRGDLQIQPPGANWNFIEQLLKEVKVKTKRMLVAKLGAEAADLGHGDISLMGVEENTMIASLCDLFERIWSHGLQVKQGKSALWSHLLHYQDLVGYEEEPKVLNPNSLSPDLSTSDCDIDQSHRLGRVSSTPASPTHTMTRQHTPRSRAIYRSEGPSPMSGSNEGSRAQSPTRYSRRSSPERVGMKPLPDSLVYDMRSVQNMTDVKSHIGYARALVRLSLEKKMLSKHMRALFSETKLIRDLYKRHAFLRSDDEREQFLYHLLSLNAVDYSCFTHSFTNTLMPYRILIIPSRKFNASTTSANVWIRLSGTLGVSTELKVPKGQLEVVFKQKNLGLLTTLTIGHDNSGMAPRWLVDYVMARNEVNGHSYRFHCGRWIGLGVDDDSTERLLVAERVETQSQEERSTEASSRSRSSSVGPSLSGSTTNLMNTSFSGATLPRRSDGHKGRSTISEIQDALGHSVNTIVKHFFKRESEVVSPSALTPLLCGELGLVSALEHVFMFGFRSSRLFGRKLYIWDYLVKFREHYLARLSSPLASQLTGVRLALIDMIGRIEGAGHALGKDGRFQVFVCLAFRDNLLCQIVKTLSSSSVTHTLYEESSFLRDRRLIGQLVQLLEPLSEFKVVLEPTLLRRLEK